MLEFKVHILKKWQVLLEYVTEFGKEKFKRKFKKKNGHRERERGGGGGEGRERETETETDRLTHRQADGSNDLTSNV